MHTIGNPDSNLIANPDAYLKPIVIIDKYLRLMTIHNSGAVAGVLSGQTKLLIAGTLAYLQTRRRLSMFGGAHLSAVRPASGTPNYQGPRLIEYTRIR